MGPGRPPNINDLVMGTNGDPVFLGVLVSTGVAVNNATTATPFSFAPLGPQGVVGATANLAGTLAGKTLLLQTSAAGQILTSGSALMTAPNVTVAQQTTIPVAQGTAPGVLIQAAERVELIMLPTDGWLQWLPVTGSANLFVWELR